MARGWDSKAVEAQIEESNSAATEQTYRKPISTEEVHGRIKRDNLLLSRRRILQELESSSNERYSDLLRRSLAELDGQLLATGD